MWTEIFFYANVCVDVALSTKMLRWKGGMGNMGNFCLFLLMVTFTNFYEAAEDDANAAFK